MPPKHQQRHTGAITSDGSLVEIYRRVPATEEVERVAAMLEPASSVLDLGSGVGRLADPLATLGHQVTAVDDSAEMLAHVRHGQTIQSRIEDLRLPQKFDAVLLASSLINYPGLEFRMSLLATVAHHLKSGGKAIIQWQSPEWFAQRPLGSYQRFDGVMRQTMTILHNREGCVLGEFTLECDGMSLTQSFETHRMSGNELRTLLERVGMRLDTDEPDSSGWLQASLQP
ncbi:hypothetical protein B1987_26005 [Mycobacterium kansasii]|uniref:Ubiquinone biosynthesis O-methyltransferase n=1 Tax=Mycobacterium attenuatum TaxID=2341086 RepID=A0A498PYL4_9MYCO|nr:class I SAM-dependent methyltransferase [Mycobacterium attenuatum]ORB87865.1 hypothetical protein B1987_26005 [Mycobacterium kansasii]VBA37879.1 Ubiquinone biosynthesis O-methyltransferase [Mycobacterium attenuatum]VBA51295.1 Ubiquinone biosynthesis O-methyltransferase [Mycobacterium attenuatum]VBA57010.1 Ubiquinone biosynthesis O-methyltransferase [Mycobacterium attenuatum]